MDQKVLIKFKNSEYSLKNFEDLFYRNSFSITYLHEKDDIFSIFQQIQLWDVNDFRFDMNNRKQILKEIAHINFPNLYKIYLREDKIQSVEGFARINLPALRVISLSNNEIISIKDLRKGKWENLFEIYLYGNKISDLGSLNRMVFESGDIIYLDWMYTLSKNHKQHCFDYRSLVKMDTNNLKQLIIQSKQRIKQPLAEKVFKKKYSEDLKFE